MLLLLVLDGTQMLRLRTIVDCGNVAQGKQSFGRISSPARAQSKVYSETEELILGTLGSYVVCVMAFGQSSSGRTHTILGECDHPHQGSCWIDCNNLFIYFQMLNQLLTVTQHCSKRYQESFSVTILEVAGERLCDLCAGTLAALARSKAQGGSNHSCNGRVRHRRGLGRILAWCMQAWRRKTQDLHKLQRQHSQLIPVERPYHIASLVTFLLSSC